MKTKWICLAMLCFGIFHLLSLIAVAGEIKLATQKEGHKLSAESEPYVRCAMDMINQPYTITKVPWGRAQRRTEDGTYDGFFIATKNDKRGAEGLGSGHAKQLTLPIKSLKNVSETVLIDRFSP
jgi:hypothetical protein